MAYCDHPVTYKAIFEGKMESDFQSIGESYIEHTRQQKSPFTGINQSFQVEKTDSGDYLALFKKKIAVLKQLDLSDK